MQVASPPDSEFLGIVEAATFLKISKGALYNKLSRGELPRYKPGKKVFFKREDLVAYIESARVPSNAEIEAEAATRSARRK
jgi:excisionase family DNA binding protein